MRYAAAAAAVGEAAAAMAVEDEAAKRPLISDPLNVELVEEFELTSKTQIQRMSEKLVIGPKR
jgi:hypothetical protein